MTRYLLQGRNGEGPYYEREADSLASVGGHFGQLAQDYTTVWVYRVDDDSTRVLIATYDADGLIFVKGTSNR